jgi:hypothetical protein
MALEVTEAGAALVFPVVHPGFAVISIASSLIVAGGWAWVLTRILRFFIAWRVNWFSAEWMWTIAMYSLSAVFWGGMAAFGIVWLRRECRIPKRLAFDRNELLWQRPAMRGVRERRWRFEDVEEARCKDLRSIVPGLTGAELIVRLRSKRTPLRFRLSGYKVALAHEFVERLNAAMSAARAN